MPPLTKKKHPVLNILLVFLLPIIMLPAVLYALGKNVLLYRSDRANPLSNDIDDAIKLLRKLTKAPRNPQIVEQHAKVLAELNRMRSNPDQFTQGVVISEATAWLDAMQERHKAAEEFPDIK